MDNKKILASISLVIAAVLWSIGGLLVKSVNSNGLAIAGARSLIAFLVFLAYLKKPRITWSKWQILGALSYTAIVISFVMANKLTTAANAILLQYTSPIHVALLGTWILKERTRLIDWVAIGVVLASMVLFFIDDIAVGNMLGNIIAVMSGVFFALFTIFMRKQKDGSPAETVLLGNALTAIIGLPFFFGDMPDMRGCIYLVILGIFQLGLSYILYSNAVKYVSALESILIPVIEPILNPVWVLIFMNEKPGIFALLGGLIILVTVTAWCVVSAKINERLSQVSRQDANT
jgi:drug/metabolite transporter (DMT)-like permease